MEGGIGDERRTMGTQMLFPANQQRRVVVFGNIGWESLSKLLRLQRQEALLNQVDI
jgi:hypothetical protein